MWYSLNWHPWCGDPYTRGISQPWRSPLRSEESEPHVRRPAQGTGTRKMSPHNVWLWKLAELTSRKAGPNPSSWANPGLIHPPGLTPPKQPPPNPTQQGISASTKATPSLLCPTQQVVLTSTSSKTAFTSGAQPRLPARPLQQLQPGLTATHTEEQPCASLHLRWSWPGLLVSQTEDRSCPPGCLPQLPASFKASRAGSRSCLPAATVVQPKQVCAGNPHRGDP